MTRAVISRLVAGALWLAWAQGHAAVPATIPAPQPAQTVPTTLLPVARSALLTVEMTMPGDDRVGLHIQRVRDQTAIVSDDVKVAVDGKNQPITRQNDGTYQMGANDLRPREHTRSK